MAEDIEKIIIEKNYSKYNILEMLGKPHFGSSYKSDEYNYFLKNNSIFFGLDIYILSIKFTNDTCDNISIIRMD